MGNFKIVIEAVGSHGCQRHVKSGENVVNHCGEPSCSDCAARAFVEVFMRTNNVRSAKLIHWADADGSFKRDTVVDDLISGKRYGSFGISFDESNIEALEGIPETSPY